jgi:uncharacterized protein YdeI (YjbR/CyaY-like superfamily)
MDPRFFATRDELRAWFEEHHAEAKELWIAYYKRGSGRTGVSYPEAVLEALCFGWIDGQVRRIDEHSYTNRFTPRGAKSTWSLVNVELAARLIREGRMRPAGRAAFEARAPERTGVYRYETGPPADVPLDPTTRREFRRHAAAFAFFSAQPPGYRREMERWIMVARRSPTRARRLAAVIVASGAGRRVDPVHPYAAPSKRSPPRKRSARDPRPAGPPTRRDSRGRSR